MTNSEPREERRKINGDLAKLVAEAGAQLSMVDDARTEMRGLRESVLVLSEAIALAPTAEEIEADARRFRIYLLAVVGLAVLILGSFAYLNLSNQRLQKQGIRCAVLQMFEHRVTNQQSHDEVFDKFHLPIPPHRPLPAEPSEKDLAQSCRPFLAGTQ